MAQNRLFDILRFVPRAGRAICRHRLSKVEEREDIIAERISPSIANAACNAGGKLLKVVEMQYKYGGKDTDRVLTLAPGAKITEEPSTVQ